MMLMMMMMMMPCLPSLSFTREIGTLRGHEEGCMQNRIWNMTLNRICNQMMFVHCTEPMPMTPVTILVISFNFMESIRISLAWSFCFASRILDIASIFGEIHWTCKSIKTSPTKTHRKETNRFKRLRSETLPISSDQLTRDQLRNRNRSLHQL